MKAVTYIIESFSHYIMEIGEINFSNIYYYHIVYITYIWNLKYNTNELIYESETDSHIENRLVAAKGGEQGRVGWEFGTSRCKLLYTDG